MSGIFNLKFESREQGNDFEYLFMHLENANRLKDTLVKYILPDEELNLIDYRLNNIPFIPSGFRFESFASRQDNMIYRTEGIIGDIWEKIKAFFKWIKEKIMGLFGGDKDSEKELPKPAEFEKVEKKAAIVVEKTLEPISKVAETNKETISEEVDKVIEKVKAAPEANKNKPLENKTTREWLGEIAKGNSTDLHEFTNNFVKAREEEAKKEAKEEEKAPEKSPDQIKRELEKQADEFVKSLEKLKSYNKKLYSKANDLSKKLETVYSSGISAENINVIDSVFGFYPVGRECLDSINDKGLNKFITGEVILNIKDITTPQPFHETCAEILKVNREDSDFFDFLGTGFITYKLDPSKYSLTVSENNLKPNKNSSDKNYKRLINLIKFSGGKKLLDRLIKRKELLDIQTTRLNQAIEVISKQIDGLSEDDRKNTKGEALTFIQKVCTTSLSSLQKKLTHTDKTISFLNELHEFEKLVLEVDNFVQQPWGSGRLSDYGI